MNSFMNPCARQGTVLLLLSCEYLQMLGPGSSYRLLLIIVASVGAFFVLLVLSFSNKVFSDESIVSFRTFGFETNFNMLALLTGFIYHLLVMNAFFAVGHRTQFSSLNFTVPFTGWDTYSFIRYVAMR